VADPTFETYVTVEGDSIDLIAFTRFGTSVGATVAIMEANPGLALNDPKLPAGLTLRIPIPAPVDRKVSTRLWS
jgi:phage tail protein X